MSKYGAYLADAMKERLHRLELDGGAVLDLREEVILMRDLCGQAAAAYHKTLERAATLTDANQRGLIKARALDVFITMLNEVRDMVTAASRIEQSSTVVPIAVLHKLVAETCDIVSVEVESIDKYRLTGVQTSDVMDRIATQLREKLLTVQASAQIGTEITASQLDDEVRAMIDTVPLVLPSEDNTNDPNKEVA